MSSGAATGFQTLLHQSWPFLYSLDTLDQYRHCATGKQNDAGMSEERLCV